MEKNLLEVSNQTKVKFRDAYHILCASVPSSLSRQALYPTHCKVPVGNKSLLHSHFEEEIFFIISGQGQMLLNTHKQLVGAGDLIRIPSGQTHQLQNIGNSDLEFLSVYSEDSTVSGLAPNVLVTAAPPTPNGPLHLGHMSGPYLAADVMTRYLRMRGSEVHLESATDDHQNYVSERAKNLGSSIEAYRGQMRERIQNGLEKFCINFDEFLEPKSNQAYQVKIKKFFLRALNKNIIEKRVLKAPFCQSCQIFLLDATIEGSCPHCDSPSRGGCENCGMVVSPHQLKSPKCGRCHSSASLKDGEFYYFNLSKYLPSIQNDLGNLPLSPRLRKLVANLFAKERIDVLVSHPVIDSDSICIPELNQSIHVWFEMAAHYETYALSHKQWVHAFGFDNAFYYLAFIPALLRAVNPATRLPHAVLTNEFLHLEGEKFSTSRNHAIWADELETEAEFLRFYLLMMRPSQKNENFSRIGFNRFQEEWSLAFRLLLDASSNSHKNSTAPSMEFLRDATRRIRGAERLYAPETFDLRQVSRQILSLADQMLNEDLGANEKKVLLIIFGQVLYPLMPKFAENLLTKLGKEVKSWAQSATELL